MNDLFGVKSGLGTSAGDIVYWSLPKLAERFPEAQRLPYSLRVLLEGLARAADGRVVTAKDVERLARWTATRSERWEIPFTPSRVVLQDFTGVPCIADLAAMRDAVARLGGDPSRVNPLVPVDLVIDHSVQVDASGTPEALAINVRKEFERNRERYEFLKWGQKAFRDLRVVPPASGIVHQVNLEHLATVVSVREVGGERVAFPDTVVGTDSHTTMINGIGVLGWGVGGIEAEAAMLGQPTYLTPPVVVGVELVGKLGEGVTATDLVLTLTELLRKHGVVDKFVEFHGAGVSALSLADRATVANMAPEYGATMGYFPIDAETIRYLRATGRDAARVELVEAYAKAQGLFRDDAAPTPDYSESLAFDLGAVEPSIAGPKRPQDRVPLSKVKASFLAALGAPVKERGYELPADAHAASREISVNGERTRLAHGSVAIAAITSCTNTSNPSVMMAAGLLAKKAATLGLKVPAHVKTSLAPGSRTVVSYLQKAGLLAALEALRFNVVGYGCTTCIGNSGPVDEAVREAADAGLVLAAVLSGNRNFEGRVHAATRANYLASPPLVVAYALAGTVDIDFETEPLGYDDHRKSVFLRDLWPSSQEVQQALASVDARTFREAYADIAAGGHEWQAISAPEGDRYRWDAGSSYIAPPPFLETAPAAAGAGSVEITRARALAMFGDSVTTDHISPAGSISTKSPAARWLLERGVVPADFNSYGARRGNHEVMLRGTFANTRLKNLLAGGAEGNLTRHAPSGEVLPIYDAAVRYAEEGTPLVIIAGRDYGMGSSRDWAAKGVRLLGVRAIIAESFERIHRSNLVGMGVLPLEFLPGESAKSLGLGGDETFSIAVNGVPAPGSRVLVTAESGDRSAAFETICRIDTPVEAEYFRAGGILPYVLASLVRASKEKTAP